MADLLFHALELPYVGNLPHFRVDLVVRQTAKGFLVVRRLAQLPDDFELQRMAQDKALPGSCAPATARASPGSRTQGTGLLVDRFGAGACRLAAFKAEPFTR
jgi:hypothetical protein